MPKRRRKLSREMEHQIKLGLKRVEFITAIINDIDEEAIQAEYSAAFEPIKNTLVILSVEYDTNGFTPQSEKALLQYHNLIKKFEDEYEL